MTQRRPATLNRPPRLVTDRVVVSLALEGDAPDLLDFHLRNRDFLAPWLPPLAPDFFTAPFWKRWGQASHVLFQQDQMARFVIRKAAGDDAPPDAPNPILGQINYANVVRGPWQACTVGYHLDRDAEGQGLMAEALSATVAYMFEVRRLNRIMANYIPDNTRSANLLERLGFEKEGYARRYLFIDGDWRDHVLTSKINPSLPVPEVGTVPIVRR